MKPGSLFIRRTLVWSAWSLVLLAGLATLFVFATRRSYEEAIQEFENQVGPAEHARYLRSPVPPEDNKVVAISAAVDGLGLEGGWSRAPEPSAWTSDDARQAREALDSAEPALAALERALALPHCVWPAVAEDATIWSAPALTSSRLLRLVGFVGVLDGKSSLVERSFRGLGTLAGCLGDQPNLVGALVAMAAHRARLEVVRAAVASPATDLELLPLFEDGLERSVGDGRIDWAVAAEGAFALHFIENPSLVGEIGRQGPFYSIFARRVATEFATRWVELRAWSGKPLEELLGAGSTEPRRGRGPAGVIAEIMIPNLRGAVMRMRIQESLARLGLVAIESRRLGREQGSYTGALSAHPALGSIHGGGGDLVIHDKRLETLLRERFLAPGAEAPPGIEAMLQLTVWRLPAVTATR